MKKLKKWLDRLLHRHRPVVYGSSFFTSAWFDEWEKLKIVLAELVESEPRWQTVLDFGCGPGVMIDTLAKRGLDYWGCDYSNEARELYLKHYGRFPSRYLQNLDEALERNYDLFISFDVLEHMRDDEIQVLLSKIKAIPELLLNISRTKGIPGHINLKNDHDWIAFMNAHGYEFEVLGTDYLRKSYSKKRPGSPDRWDRNLFLFRRVSR